MTQVNFLQSLGWSLINSLWQMAVLWAVYKFITVIFNKEIRSKHKTSLAITFTIGGFVWFTYTLFASLITAKAPAFDILSSGVVSDTGWSYFAKQILPYFTIVYLIALVIPVWQFIRNYRFVKFIRTEGLKKVDVAWRLYVRNTASALGIARKVNVWLSEWVTSPVTIGYLKPIILLPASVISNLSPTQLEAIILHELSHIYRNDYFLNLIISFIKTIFYFNPFVKLFVKDIEREREFSCDELVLQYQYKPGEYASALLRLEQNKHRQMLMAAAGKNHDLLHRIESILGMQKKGWNPLRQVSLALLTILSVCLLHFLVSVNNKKNDQQFYSLSNESSPYYLLYGERVSPAELTVNKEMQKAMAAVPKKVTNKKTTTEAEYSYSFNEEETQSPFIHVNFTNPVIPELAPEQEAEVKKAVDATRKIIRENEWKQVERSYADALTTYEKNKLRSEYIAEANQSDNVDWNKLEDQLRLSYEQINWDNLNQKINSSLAQIKMDSIQCLLTVNLKNLTDLEKLLTANDIKVIPDSQISLEVVKENQQKAKEQLAKLRATREKKVIKL